MIKYVQMPWKKHFQTLPSHLKAKIEQLEDDNFLIGCVKTVSRTDLEEGIFQHLKIDVAGENLIVVDRVVPPTNIGKFSKRNREGWEQIRKDLPKYTKNFSIESPNFGDWTKGYHTVNWNKLVYHRDIFEPLDLVIEVEKIRETSSGAYVIKFFVDFQIERSSKHYIDDLMFVLNLLQENTGLVDIFPINATNEHLLSTHTLNWEIFPPESVDDIIRIMQSSRRSADPDKSAVIQQRLKFFGSLSPKQLLRGVGGLNQYVGAVLDDDLVVFENVRKGNALYVLYEDWQQISKLSRRDILRSTDIKYDRFEHTARWVERVKSHLQNEMSKRGKCNDLFKSVA